MSGLPVFYRGTLPDLWIGLSSLEPLGLVDGVHWVRDLLGVGGQVSLLSVASGVSVPVPLAVWGSGPSLGGKTALAPLGPGEYRIRGEVVTAAGAIQGVDLGFLLADGPAPENGSVALDSGALSAPSVVLPVLEASAVAESSPQGPVAFPSAADALLPLLPLPGASVGLQGGMPGPLVLQPLAPIVAILRPGGSVVFPAPDPFALPFPPLTTSVEF